MPERKRKREVPELLDFEETSFVLEPETVELGSAYSLSLSYDEDSNPIIHVKTYGKVNTQELRKEIERLYPGATIKGLRATRARTYKVSSRAKPRKKRRKRKR